MTADSKVSYPHSSMMIQRSASMKPRGRQSRAKACVLRRSLSQLESGLSQLHPAERRAAILDLPPKVRSALLEHMLTSGPLPSQRNTRISSHPSAAAVKMDFAPSTADSVICRGCPAVVVNGEAVALHLQTTNLREASCDQPDTLAASSAAAAGESAAVCSPAASAVPEPVADPQQSSKNWVRTVGGGRYQASIGFNNFVIRSRTCASRAEASSLARALCAIRARVSSSADEALGASAGTAAGGTDSKADSDFEQRLTKAFESVSRVEAPCLSIVESNRMQVTFSSSVSVGSVGKIDSPTTTSLEQALEWRRRFLAARLLGWEAMRRTWLEVLQEPRLGCSKPLSLAAAHRRVESSFECWAERQASLGLKRQQRAKKAHAHSASLLRQRRTVVTKRQRDRTQARMEDRLSLHSWRVAQRLEQRSRQLVEKAKRRVGCIVQQMPSRRAAKAARLPPSGGKKNGTQ
mmetsp:Transcript_37848/g.88472  ORF Transcript_37848/g.88472 Transcript_37848/m.88472 type:complete len:464 (-) Transcript_37848:173-1564(-)